MSGEWLSAVSAAASAVAAVAALVVAYLGLREGQRARTEYARRGAHEMDALLQSRLDPLYPGLRSVLGHVEDGVPREIRDVLIPFFVLYSDAYAAHRDGLLDHRDWIGFKQELAYWSQKPAARRAWRAFRQQTWTEGFVAHVDAALAGPPAYPELREMRTSEPEIHWPAAEQAH